MPLQEEHVFIGMGGNLSSAQLGPPKAVMQAALEALPAAGIVVQRRSRWYRSIPVPPSAQPAFINGVLKVRTSLTPDSLLEALHAVEAAFGRVRGKMNAARILDLDLLAYGPLVINRPGGLQLPHPRLHLRTFVLLPLMELAGDWRHPHLLRTASQLLAEMPADVAAGQCAEVIAGDVPAAEGSGD